MSLSKKDLAQLTERVNERLAEFEFPPAFTMEGQRLSRGIVRLIHNVIGEWQEEEDERGAEMARETIAYLSNNTIPVPNLGFLGLEFMRSTDNAPAQAEPEEPSQAATEMSATRLADAISARLLKNSIQKVKETADLVQSQQAVSEYLRRILPSSTAFQPSRRLLRQRFRHRQRQRLAQSIRL